MGSVQVLSLVRSHLISLNWISDGSQKTFFLENDIWSSGPDLPAPIMSMQVVKYSNNGFVMMGGLLEGKRCTKNAEKIVRRLGYNWPTGGEKQSTWLYDASTNQFETKSDMIQASYQHTAVLMPGSNGLVLVGYGINMGSELYK